MVPPLELQLVDWMFPWIVLLRMVQVAAWMVLRVLVQVAAWMVVLRVRVLVQVVAWMALHRTERVSRADDAAADEPKQEGQPWKQHEALVLRRIAYYDGRQKPPSMSLPQHQQQHPVEQLLNPLQEMKQPSSNPPWLQYQKRKTQPS
jgi:hypothetical protein